MTDTTALKNRIRAAIKQNNNQEITGPILQNALLDIVDELSDNRTINDYYNFIGIAIPTTSAPSGLTEYSRIFYIAIQNGTYTNLGNVRVSNEIAIIKYNGSSWSKESLIAIDEEPTVESNNLVKSRGVKTSLENGLSLLSGVVSRSGVPISSASLEDRIASNDAADKKRHSIRFSRVTDDAITAVGYGITGSIMGNYLDVLWSTALHRFVAYDSSSGLYYSEWAGPYVPSSSEYTSVSSSRPEEQSTPYYDKVYIDNAGGVYAYSPSERSLVTADIDLSYLTGVSGIEMSSGGTLDMGLGSITKVDSLVMSGAGSGSISNVKHLTMNTGGELDMSGGTLDMGLGSISNVKHLTMNTGSELDIRSGTINGVDRINMRSGTIRGVGQIDMSGGTISMQSGGKISGVRDIQMTDGTIDKVGTISNGSGGIDISASGIGVSINGVLISGYNSESGEFEPTIKKVDHIAMNSGTLDGIKSISINGDGTLDLSSAKINAQGAVLSGILNIETGVLEMRGHCSISGYNNTYISGMIYESGNTFTTGFIDELKAALGIS